MNTPFQGLLGPQQNVSNSPQGLLGNFVDTLNDPMFQMGVGLLARRDHNLGQALGGAMNDRYIHQHAQSLFDQRQTELEQMRQEMAQQQRQQEWMQENMPRYAGAPPAFQTEAFKSHFAQPKQTSLMQNLVAAGLRPGTQEYQQAMMRAVNKPATQINLGPKLPAGYMWTNPNKPGQGLTPIPGGPAEKATEGQQMAAGYADRMGDAAVQLDQLEMSGFSPAAISEWGPARVSNYLASPEYQTYRAAQEDWVRAKLRKESGAVIGEEEMDREIATYFPRPGDSEAVKARKRRQRETAERAMTRAAGPQYMREAQQESRGGTLSTKEMSELEQLRKSQAR